MRVTLRDVYDAVGELKDVVVELKTEVAKSAARADAEKEIREDHEQRLRAVERKVWALPSAAGLLAAVSVALEVLRWHGK